MKKASKTLKNCKWLRDHASSTKPTATHRVKTNDGFEYVGLSNGQLVRPHTAKRMGV